MDVKSGMLEEAVNVVGKTRIKKKLVHHDRNAQIGQGKTEGK